MIIMEQLFKESLHQQKKEVQISIILKLTKGYLKNILKTF